MHDIIMADLQFFAAESAPAAAETASGAETADAGQNNVTDAACAPQEAPSPARKSWEEVRADYKAEFDAEVQAIADYNGDGTDDLLLRTAGGVVGAALITGADTVTWAEYGALGAEWSTKGVGIL